MENNGRAPLGRSTIVWLGCTIVFFILMVVRFHREDYTPFDAFNFYYPLIEHVCHGAGETQHPLIPPLLPWAQGLFMRLVGLQDPARGAQWFNIGLLLPLNLLVVWGLLGRLARPATSRWPAIFLSTAFILLSPLILWRSLTTGNEMLYSLCWGALLLFFLRYLDRRDVLSLVLVALCAGLCALVRGEGIIWPGVLTCIIVWLHRISAVTLQRLALVWLVMLLVWTPRLAFMQQITGMPVPDIRLVEMWNRLGGGGFLPHQAYEPVIQPQHSALMLALERKAFSKSPRYMSLLQRLVLSSRGVVITFGPLGLLYLLVLWPAVRRKVAAAWQGRYLLLLHGMLVLQFSVIALIIWFEERYGSSLVPLLSMTGGIVFSEVLGCWSQSRRGFAHLLLAGIMGGWALLVMWKLPSHRLEKNVADALRDRVSPGALVMSLLPTIPYYLQARWLPAAGCPLYRVQVNSEQLVQVCREAKVDVVIDGDFPMFRGVEWWLQDDAARDLVRRFRIPVDVPAEGGRPPLVLDAKRMREEATDRNSRNSARQP